MLRSRSIQMSGVHVSKACGSSWKPLFSWTASSLSFSSDLVRAMHARGSGGAARRAKRGWQPEKKKESRSFFVSLPSRAIGHARGHLRVSRFARQTTQKRETARSLLFSLFLFKNHKDTFCLQVWQLKASHASPLPWKFLAFPTWKLQNWQTKFLVKVIWYLISQGRAQKFHTDDASLPRFG